ncbi:GNAT family N-acetyltransferase [Mycobacterium sp.]|uniref:GNAT family N-acetyltransferase n=1 Tax=Mycobacterium sp. TaxID=1785 RepID=UPI002D91CA5C|nr:GNAT family N-acetyltransferase [Mycobacterium sp.]
MEVRFHGSVDEFRAIAEPIYRRDPVTHTIELTALLNAPPDSTLLTVWNAGIPIGAAMQTPPYPLACNAIPADCVDAVAEAVARVRPELTGARGARDATVAFSDAWGAVTGRTGHVSVGERLYRLGTLRPPSGVAGLARTAHDGDRRLLVDWVERFFVETFSHQRNDAAGERFIDAAADKGDQFILWSVDATPVSMAMLRAPAAGVSRIGPVFTPSTHRGHGYGSAVTAAAAALALRRGVTDVVLFADLANPTSNAIYQRIGFEAVGDSVRIDFVTVE